MRPIEAMDVSCANATLQAVGFLTLLGAVATLLVGCSTASVQGVAPVAQESGFQWY